MISEPFFSVGAHPLDRLGFLELREELLHEFGLFFLQSGGLVCVPIYGLN